MKINIFLIFILLNLTIFISNKIIIEDDDIEEEIGEEVIFVFMRRIVDTPDNDIGNQEIKGKPEEQVEQVSSIPENIVRGKKYISQQHYRFCLVRLILA